MFMKKILILITIICSSYINAQNFIWADNSIQNTNTYLNGSNHITCDEESNAYVTGCFWQNLSIGTTSISAPGQAGFFLAKYDVKGDVKWVIHEVTNDQQYATDICYDNDGHIYITGVFEGTVHFGTTTFTQYNAGYSSFIAKYDTAGSFIWAKEIPFQGTVINNPTNIGFNSIVADNAGNIVLGGAKGGNNSIMLESVLIGSGSYFLTAKYDANGNLLWASTGTGNLGPINIIDVAADKIGNYFSIGNFGSYLNPVPQAIAVFGTDTVKTNGYIDCFIVKYNSNGTPLWVKSFGGLQSDQVYDIETDSINNFYVLGYSADSANYFIRKYDTNGNSIWTRYTPGQNLRSISIDNRNNISFCGYSSVTTVVGKIDTNGNILWVTSNSDGVNSQAEDITSAKNGNSFVCGNYSSDVRFGSNLLLSPTTFPNYYTVLINDSTYVPPHKNKITGNIYVDANINCNYDLGENNLPGVSVIAQPGNYCAVSDNLGNYKLNVDSANYTITQILPFSSSINTSQICPNSNNSYSVNAQSTNSTYSGYDFGDDVKSCPFLKITLDNTSNNSILCNTIINRAFVVSNIGATPSVNTQLSVRICKLFTPLSSTPVWTSYNAADSTAFFNIGTLLPNNSYTVIIHDSVNCNYFPWQANAYIHVARVTPLNDCLVADSTFNTFTLAENYSYTVSSDTYTNYKHLKIYPNPTKDKIILESTEQLGKIIITNILGETVYQSTINCKSQDIDLSNLYSGIYYINTLGQHRTIIKE